MRFVRFRPALKGHANASLTREAFFGGNRVPCFIIGTRDIESEGGAGDPIVRADDATSIESRKRSTYSDPACCSLHSRTCLLMHASGGGKCVTPGALGGQPTIPQGEKAGVIAEYVSCKFVAWSALPHRLSSVRNTTNRQAKSKSKCRLRSVHRLSTASGLLFRLCRRLR